MIENVVFQKLSKKIVADQRARIAKMKEEKASREAYDERRRVNKEQTDRLLKLINEMEGKSSEEKAEKKAKNQLQKQKKIDEEADEIWDTL